jgi:nicotinamidase/pyrazinamidase
VSFLPRDPETHLPGRRLLAHVHRLHVGMGRPLPAPPHHVFDRWLRTLEHRLHTSVGCVADPSRHAEGASLLGACGAEEHSLDDASDDDMDASHRDSVPQPGCTLPGVTTYDERIALLAVDIQNDFADPSGTLSVDGGDAILPRVNQEIAEAGGAGALVVYTQDWHPPSTPHFFKDGGIWPEHCVQGTWGAEFYPDLHVEGEIVRKGFDGSDGYSGFSVRDPESGETSPTTLEALLREHGIERLVICGLATDYCVVETVLDARTLGFPVEVVKDAVRAVDLDPGDGDRAIARMRGAGAEIV